SSSRAPTSSSTRTPRPASTSGSRSRGNRSKRGDPRRPSGGLGMARPQSRYICQRCAETFVRWEGQCRACGEWNSLVETIVREPSRAERHAGVANVLAEPARLGHIAETDLPRLSLGIGEL